MPYGDLTQERVQRFASLTDIDIAHCTVEEREEYEPHIIAGNVVFAGVDYAEILCRAEREVDIVVWDGGITAFHSSNPTCISLSPMPCARDKSRHTSRVRPDLIRA